jgi:16S rRNA (uracil1498-N3)-methyltransferase
MTRIFVEPASITGSSVEFDNRDSHHLAVVLKRRTGDSVLVCDGLGAEYLVVLETVGKSCASGRITDMFRPATEPTIKITVAQSLPKTLEKLEWVLQHGTELGAVKFIPFYSARSREDWRRLLPKQARWQEIVRTAAEQSRRVVCPSVEAIKSFDDIINVSKDYELTLFAYESETETTLKSILGKSSPSTVLIVIGPEGGFTDQEAQTAKEHSTVTISLGPRILRTETAALCLLSQIHYAYEQS